MNKETASRSISACIENGKQLLGDAKLLLDWDRYSTALALSVLAQEEFAKAFLLQLVADGALPWTWEVRQSMARHQSKHLFAIVMEWLPPFDFDRLEEQRKRSIERHEEKMAWYARSIERSEAGHFGPDPDDPEPTEEEFIFPREVASALNIYRFEEIERIRSGNPMRDPAWSKGKARKIADGLLDRKKQSAFYVDIGRTGEVGLHPGRITREEALEAVERAERLSDPFLAFSDEYQRLKEVLPLVFANLKEND
jgi:AbiV family abortive infection protein